MDNVKSIRSLLSKNIIWIVLAYLVLGFFIGTIYLNSVKIYEAKSLIQFEQANPLGQGVNSIQPFIFGSSQIEEQAKIYKSVKNLEELVNSLGLNILIAGLQQSHENTDFYKNLSVKVFKNSFEPQSIKLIFTNEGYYLDSSDKLNPYGKSLRSDFLEILILRDKEVSYEDSELNITVLSNIDAIKRLDGSLSVNPFLIQTYDASLMEITFRHHDVSFAKKVINTLNDIYLVDSVYQNATQARASVEFLDKLLEDFSSQLKIDEEKLNQFQEENLFVQENEEASTLFARLNQLELRLDEIKIQELEFKNRLTAKSPFFINILEQKEFLQDEIKEVLSDISKLPKNQQTYISLLRDVEANTKVVEDLLAKKLEFSIIEASTISDVRIIDKAYENGIVSPNLMTYLFMYLISATILIIIFLSFQIIFSPFKYPSELEELTNLRLIGVIPELSIDTDDRKDKVARDNLITNLQMVTHADKASYLVAGPLSGVGKTMISRIIAEGFSKLGRKTVLIDCDYYRGDLHKEFPINRRKLDTLMEENFNLEDWKVNDKLYVITRPISGSRSSLAFFESQDFMKLIEKTKSESDIVVIDSPPLLSLPDPLVLTRHVDKVLLTARHAITKPRELLESFNQINVVTDKEILTVYNGYKRSILDYGYYEYYRYKYYSPYYSYEKD